MPPVSTYSSASYRGNLEAKCQCTRVIGRGHMHQIHVLICNISVHTLHNGCLVTAPLLHRLPFSTTFYRRVCESKNYLNTSTLFCSYRLKLLPRVIIASLLLTLTEIILSQDGERQIDIRHYLIALSTIHRPSKSVETLKLAFKVSTFNHDGSGLEFFKSLR